MKQASELSALVNRLEISGSDRTRWPAQERLRFAPLIAQSDEARRLLAEAAALDRLLDAAPAADPGKLDALIDRICAAAEAEGQLPADNVVSISAARRSPAAPAKRALHQRSGWQAAALLAASLFVGAFVGTSGLLGSAVSSLGGEVNMAEADMDSLDAIDLVLSGNRSSLLEEDTL